jgi:ubiquinone/menaquinone biosynthesis C-methylase UbiE
MKSFDLIRKLNDAHAMVYDAILNLPFYDKHLNQIIKELDPRENGTYLDTGCGTGNLLKIAKDKRSSFIGVDFSKEMLERAKRKSRNLIMADLHHLPFKECCIDGVTNVNVLYQLKYPKRFLTEVHRILKPGGKIIISTPGEGASFSAFFPIFLKSILVNPNILRNLRKLVKYGKINKKIINANPNTFYKKRKLKGMLEGFKIRKIEKAYVGQNWLISAYKFKSIKAESKN